MNMDCRVIKIRPNSSVVLKLPRDLGASRIYRHKFYQRLRQNHQINIISSSSLNDTIAAYLGLRILTSEQHTKILECKKIKTKRNKCK